MSSSASSPGTGWSEGLVRFSVSGNGLLQDALRFQVPCLGPLLYTELGTMGDCLGRGNSSSGKHSSAWCLRRPLLAQAVWHVGVLYGNCSCLCPERAGFFAGRSDSTMREVEKLASRTMPSLGASGRPASLYERFLYKGDVLQRVCLCSQVPFIKGRQH
eukprot:1009942-Amphidinium_carterae.1